MKLSEGCNLISGYAFKSSDFNTKGSQVLKIANIKPLAVDLRNCQRVTIDDLNKMKKYLVQENDILIAMTGQGSVGKVGIIRGSINKLIYINQRVGKFICDEETINNLFLYYILSSEKYYRLLFELGSGTGQPNLSPDQILSVEIPNVPYKEQKQIGIILNNIDKKILNNIKHMDILNSQIYLIYQDKFVNCDYNTDNKKSYLSVLDVVIEKREKNTSNNNYPVLSVLKEGQFKISEDVFTKQIYSKSTKNYKIVRRNEVAYNPARANIGSIAMLKEFEVGLVSPIYTVFKLKDSVTPTFFYYYMKQPIFLEMIRHHAIGTTRQNFPLEAFKMFPIYIPSMELQLEFEKIAKPIEQKIYLLKKENKILENIRNILLPKLIHDKMLINIEE